ncbi:unnamed protein product [Ixodes persulcatus]
MLFAPFGSKPSSPPSEPLYESSYVKRPVHEPDPYKPSYSLTPPRSYHRAEAHHRPESPYRAPPHEVRSKSRSGPWISAPEEHWVPPPSHWEPPAWQAPKPKHGAFTIKIRPAAPEEDHHHHHSWDDHGHHHGHGHGHAWSIDKKPHYKTVDAKVRIPPVKFRLHVSPKIRIVSGTKDPLERPPPPEPEEHFPWEKPSTGWHKPSSGWEKPPAGWEKYASGWEKPSSGGWDRYASSGWEKPSGGWEKSSGGWEKPSGWERVSSGWEKPSSSGWEKPSSSGWEKPSSSGWEKPSSSGWEKPSSSGWEKYASSSGWQKPPSSGWESSPPSGWHKPSSWDDSHHRHFKPHHRHYPPDYPRYDPHFRIKVHPHIVTDPPPTTTTTTTEAPTSSSLRTRSDPPEYPSPEDRVDRTDATTPSTTTTTTTTTTTPPPSTTTETTTTYASPEPTTSSEEPAEPTSTFYTLDVPDVGTTTPRGLERESPTSRPTTEIPIDSIPTDPESTTKHSISPREETTTGRSTAYTEPLEEHGGITPSLLPEKRSRDPVTTAASVPPGKRLKTPVTTASSSDCATGHSHSRKDHKHHSKSHRTKEATSKKPTPEIEGSTPAAVQTTSTELDAHNEVPMNKPEESAKPSKTDQELPLVADASSPEEVSTAGLNA